MTYDTVTMQSTADEITRLRAELEAAKANQLVLAIPDECPHIIVYDDADVPNETFAGYGAREAAMERWFQISANWNAHLFAQIDVNSGDSEHPSALFRAESAFSSAFRAGWIAGHVACGETNVDPDTDSGYQIARQALARHQAAKEPTDG